MNNFYLTGKILCLSPIAVGSGLSELTDKDVLLDTDGNPFIPGTTLAGVCRHYLEDSGASADDIASLFGSIASSDSDSESRIVFYESFPESVGEKIKFRKSFRDGIKLDDEGTTDDTAKYDYEIIELEDGTYFRFRLEISNYSDKDKALLVKMIYGINSGKIRVGHKSSRGLGRINLTELHSKAVKTAADYIAFDWQNVTDNADELLNDKSDDAKTEVAFINTAFITVANNATLERKSDGRLINSEPVKNINREPVVPGSAWAGIFRHHFKKILLISGYFKSAKDCEAFLDEVFGSTNGASKIIFDESAVKGATCMLSTRNAIDRFTGGAGDKKLFTDQLAFGGELTLTVTLKSGLSDDYSALAKQLINLTIADLKDGTLNIGAHGSIGGGILQEKEAAGNE